MFASKTHNSQLLSKVASITPGSSLGAVVGGVGRWSNDTWGGVGGDQGGRGGTTYHLGHPTANLHHAQPSLLGRSHGTWSSWTCDDSRHWSCSKKIRTWWSLCIEDTVKTIHCREASKCTINKWRLFLCLSEIYMPDYLVCSPKYHGYHRNCWKSSPDWAIPWQCSYKCRSWNAKF